MRPAGRQRRVLAVVRIATAVDRLFKVLTLLKNEHRVQVVLIGPCSRVVGPANPPRSLNRHRPPTRKVPPLGQRLQSADQIRLHEFVAFGRRQPACSRPGRATLDPQDVVHRFGDGVQVADHHDEAVAASPSA